jgi:hypothetical protein
VATLQAAVRSHIGAEDGEGGAAVAAGIVAGTAVGGVAGPGSAGPTFMVTATLIIIALTIGLITTASMRPIPVRTIPTTMRLITHRAVSNDHVSMVSCENPAPLKRQGSARQDSGADLTPEHMAPRKRSVCIRLEPSRPSRISNVVLFGSGDAN